MTNIAEKLNIDLESLSTSDKATLAHYLIEELDVETDQDVEEAWRREAEERYQAYLNGKLSAICGNDVMMRARERFE